MSTPSLKRRLASAAALTCGVLAAYFLAFAAAAPPRHLIGTKKADHLVGSNRSETIDGLAGRDVILGRGSGDTLRGGGGFDRIVGGRGNDRLIAGPGGARMTGGPGRDEFNVVHGRQVGGRGRDVIYARDGRQDQINCGPGNHDKAVVDRSEEGVYSCETVIEPSSGQ